MPVPDGITRDVIAIIARQANLPAQEITPSATPEDLGLDSLGLAEMVFAVEEQFGISVPYDQGAEAAQGFDVASVARIIDAVKGLIAEQSQ